MPTPAITFTVNGPTYIASEKAPLIAPPGASVKIVVDPGVRNAVVNCFDFTGKKPVIIDSDTTGPYEFTVRVPGAGLKRIVGIECRANHAQVVPTQSFTIIGQGVAGKPNTDTDPPTNTPPVVTEPPVVTPPKPKLTGKMDIGLVSLASASYAAVKDLIAPLKLSSLRVWYDTQDFTGQGRPNVARVLEYEAAGISAVWCMAQDGMMPALAKNAVAWTLAAVADLIGRYDANAATKGKTLRIEWGNEPDLQLDRVGKYWRGTVNEWANVFALVCRAVKAQWGNRVQMIAAGFSWDISALAGVFPILADAGADAIAFHGYPRDMSSGALKPYKTFADLAHSRGLLAIVTEGSPGYGKAVKDGTKKLADWHRDWPTYLIALEAAGVDECQLFNAQDINSPNSAGALFDRSWQPTPAYTAVREGV